MIDTHCHLDSPLFDADRDEVLSRAFAAGVTDIVIPGIGPSNWEPLLSLAQAAPKPGHPRLHVGVGIHPQFLPELPPADDDRHLATLDALLTKGVARSVGECGLDGPTLQHPGGERDRQLAVMAAHLQLAKKHRLPLLIHCFRMHEDLFRLLDEVGELPASGILHSYSGGKDQAKKYEEWDLYFSFAGPVSYEKARKAPESVRAVKRDRLLLETDAPDQTPRPHHGRCEPAYVTDVCAAVAKALAVSPEEVATLTDANARRLLKVG